MTTIKEDIIPGTIIGVAYYPDPREKIRTSIYVHRGRVRWMVDVSNRIVVQSINNIAVRGVDELYEIVNAVTLPEISLIASHLYLLIIKHAGALPGLELKINEGKNGWIAKLSLNDQCIAHFPFATQIRTKEVILKTLESISRTLPSRFDTLNLSGEQITSLFKTKQKK
jgi:hypothetical protein